jgi:23S rRNA (adenine2503-C2)-methyltransferase
VTQQLTRADGAALAPGTPSLYGLELAGLEALCVSLGEPRYRGRQLAGWLYRRSETDFGRMTDLPPAFRERLAQECEIAGAPEVRRQETPGRDTRKALLRLSDGELIEAVLMTYGGRSEASAPRATVCVSSQAGCAMGCTFCATGQMGFRRNLTAAEIVGQVMHFARELSAEGERITNVVFMGMGEPFANYEQVLRAVRILHDPALFGLGARNITLSTVGLVRGIDRLSEEPLQLGLAVSLHAPNDALRRRLVPTASPDSVGKIVAASRRYTARTGRRVTFEYALIERVNDEPATAIELAALLKGVNCHVNLIPLNPTANGVMRRPSRTRVLAFQRELTKRGVPCTVRVEKGVEISAACGQLRTDAGH